MRHNSGACDHHEYDVAPTYFTQGVRCPKCANARKGKTRQPVTLEEFYERLHAIYPEGEYIVIGEYVNISTVTSVQHSCGHVFNVIPTSLVSTTYRSACRICQHANKIWTHERFEEEMRKAGDGAEEYVPLTRYSGYNSPILLLHKPSGVEWETTPNTFLAGGARYNPHRNPRNSSYHRAAKRALTELGIAFEEEKSFPDLKSPFSGRPLWFDFWLPNHKLLIEIDGELHWTTHRERHGGGQAYLDRRRALDHVKNEWAASKNEGIRLIRIVPTSSMSIKLQLEIALRA
jgi:glutaredoxin